MIASEAVRSLLGEHGPLRAQGPSEWKGNFVLPPTMVQFYAEVGPVDITIEEYGNPYYIPSLSKLWQYQAGYRWDGVTGERIEDWDDDWLVVADQGADPFICLRSSGRVFFARHGEGEWDAGEMFGSMNEMAASLATLGRVRNQAGEDFTDEDCNIRPKYRAVALRSLAELLGSPTEAEAILASLGWG